MNKEEDKDAPLTLLEDSEKVNKKIKENHAHANVYYFKGSILLIMNYIKYIKDKKYILY